MTEKGYKAMATTVRALNVSSLLLAYQAKLEVDMSSSPTPALCDELRAPFPANAPGQVFTQPRAPPPAYRIQKRQPHPTHGAGRGQNKPPEHSGAWAMKPPAPGVAPVGRAAPSATQGGVKKQRAT
ncbi:unnamed protein product [Arctogadus glacialis]